MATRDIPSLSLRAVIQPQTANAEKRTVDLTWTTGARVLRSSYWDDDFYEELSCDPAHVRMGRLQSGAAPLLADHRAALASQIGVVESASVDGKQGAATVRFSAEGIDPEADRIFAKIKDGIIRNVSVGYRVHKFVKQEDGSTTIPVMRAQDWEPYEISAVALPADAGATFRDAGADKNPCEFIVNRGAQESKKMEETKPAETPAVVDVNALKQAALTAERARVLDIQNLCRKAKLDDLATKLVQDGSTVDQARALVLDEMAKRADAVPTNSQHSGIQVGEESHEKFQRGVSAWLIEKSGKGVVELAKERNVKGFEKVDLDGAEFRGMSIVDIARECLDRRGVSTRGMYDRHDLVKRALSHRHGGNASTSDFSVLFENVLHKTMRAAYSTQADTWRRFCGTDTVQDFRNSNRFLNGSFGTLDVVAESGEYKHKSIPDGAKVAINTQTYGNIIGVTRQMLVNDDMGAMADLATRFGRSAGLSIEIAVYAMLQDNTGTGPTLGDSNPFFHSSRANVGTGAALTVASLVADKVRIRKQKDISSNEYLDLLPRILLVPAELEADANLINVNATDPTASATTGKANIAKGMFSDIVSSPRLTSSVRRWMFTESKEAFKVVFLEGSGEGPVMESERDFDTDGLKWKARIDFKVNPYDPKTALMNAGQ